MNLMNVENVFGRITDHQEEVREMVGGAINDLFCFIVGGYLLFIFIRQFFDDKKHK